MSRSVRDHVHGRLGLEFDEIGPLTLKNIARPIEAFVLKGTTLSNAIKRESPPVLTSLPPCSAIHRINQVAPESLKPFERTYVGGSSAVRRRGAKAGSDPRRRSAARPDNPLSGRHPFKGKAATTRQIGRELGVRFVLEGSVRRLGNQIRVNAQLIDAESDTHLWAERFDGDTSDLFALQDGITSRIAVALDLELLGAEATRSTNNPDAVDYILRGRAVYLKGPTRDNYEQAIKSFERALTLDQHSNDAKGWLATELAGRVLDGLTGSPEIDLARANDLIAQARTEGPRSALVHFARGQVLRAQRHAAEALAEYETVISLNRNHVNALAAISWCKVYLGMLDGAIPALEEVIRLSPRDPQIGVWFARIGLVHLLQSRIEEAIIWLEKARNANPELPYVHGHLASAYALNDDIESASARLAEARTLRGGDSYSSISQIRATGYFGVPAVGALYESTVFAGLRRAGMPDE